MSAPVDQRADVDPLTARMMLPGWSMLNTRIGRPLSMHSEIAVESITWSPRLSTSM